MDSVDGTFQGENATFEWLQLKIYNRRSLSWPDDIGLQSFLTIVTNYLLAVIAALIVLLEVLRLAYLLLVGGKVLPIKGVRREIGDLPFDEFKRKYG